jgi:uncharacterized DUF497 family protein
VTFEWDTAKAERNLRVHGISFTAAADVFRDSARITWTDDRRQYGEIREITIGLTGGQELLVVVHTTSSDALRIISARRANRRERYRHEHRKS